MQFNLYKLDYAKGSYVPTRMGEYATLAQAENARENFRKRHSASWMISANERHPLTDGKPISLANL